MYGMVSVGKYTIHGCYGWWVMQPLPAVFVRTFRSHWCHGQMASWLWRRNEKNGGSRKWVDEYVKKKGLNSDTKQLTKCCFNGGGGVITGQVSCLVMTLRWKKQIILRFNVIFHVPALNARMVRVAQPSRSEASFLLTRNRSWRKNLG